MQAVVFDTDNIGSQAAITDTAEDCADGSCLMVSGRREDTRQCWTHHRAKSNA